MSYTHKTWASGDVISASALNNMEQGIVDLNDAVNDIDTSGGSVTVTPVLTSGTLIATINGTAIYAPSYTNGDEVSY